MTEATEVREVLDRFEEQDWGRHTDNAYETIEAFTEAVVEDGTYLPDGKKFDAELSLTPKERLTGNRTQDMTFVFAVGMMLGSALERDIPADAEAEEQWKNGEFELPE